MARLGAGLVAAVGLAAFVVAPVAAHILGHGPNTLFLGDDARGQTLLLGTDGILGRDEFLRLLYGGRRTFAVACAVAVAVGASTALLFRDRRRAVVAGSVAGAAAITLELVLGAAGTGFSPPNASWGNMLANGLNNALDRPALAVWPLVSAALGAAGFILLAASGLAAGRDPR